MIVAVTSLKGGVGKSTIATNLAVCFSHMGYKTVIVDTDTNASSVHWSGLRDEDAKRVSVVGITDSEALRKNIKHLSQDYEMIIIDGTPSLSRLVSTIMVLGDIILIPLKPSGLDLWATEKFLEKYEQAKALKDVEAYFILNEYDAKINLNKELKEALGELEIGTLNTTIKSRVAYKEAIVMGIGAFEHTNKQAKEEVTQLTNEVVQLIQKKLK